MLAFWQAFQKLRMDGWTDGRTDRRTNVPPLYVFRCCFYVIFNQLEKCRNPLNIDIWLLTCAFFVASFFLTQPCFSDSECFYHFLFMCLICIGECVPLRDVMLRLETDWVLPEPVHRYPPSGTSVHRNRIF